MVSLAHDKFKPQIVCMLVGLWCAHAIQTINIVSWSQTLTRKAGESLVTHIELALHYQQVQEVCEQVCE